MALIVQKFGGSSVANTDKMKNVAQIITDTYKAGNEVVVVVSAQGDTTDEMIAKAEEISKSPSKREMDMLLSSGEQMSASLLAMTMQEMGFPAISLTGWQIGLNTDSSYSNARIKSVSGERITKELGRKNIVVVAGFQGLNRSEDITTLGRGGSDTTAVAIAASLGADLCQIYTDVDGIFTADPRQVKQARKLQEISFDEMIELASLGAQVLHNRSVELAKKYNVNLEVCSSFRRVAGTKVKEVCRLEKMLVRGIARDDNLARISVVEVPDLPGVAFKIFSLLAQKKINVDIILQSIGRNNTKDISFTVGKQNLAIALEILEEHREEIGASQITHKENVSKISVVGAGMVNNPGIAAKIFEALYEADINIKMISTSEIKISVLIDLPKAELAMNAIHDKLGLSV